MTSSLTGIGVIDCAESLQELIKWTVFRLGIFSHRVLHDAAASPSGIITEVEDAKGDVELLRSDSIIRLMTTLET